MTLIIGSLYCVLLFVSFTNLIFMKRPRGKAAVCFEVLIPARNEAQNLENILIPLIHGGVRVTVFDDESEDETRTMAERLGAHIMLPPGPLEPGWTGKNRGCHCLAQSATAEWSVFLDADTIPSADFAECLSSYLSNLPKTQRVITGFPKMLRGEGIEPLYLGWVPWILLATNPFGLVAISGKGHNRFTNGQFSAWRTDFLQELKPHEIVRGEILEDVKIGRLLGSRQEPVDVLNVSKILSVRMYRTIDEAFHGMCKNSADIAGSSIGTWLLALFFVLLGLGWLFCGKWALLLYGGLVLSKVFADRVIRYPVWTAPWIPITAVGGAITLIVSSFKKKRGLISWKGRQY